MSKRPRTSASGSGSGLGSNWPTLHGVGSTYADSPGVPGISMKYERGKALARLGAKWYYDWSPNPKVYPGVEAVPMIWSAGDVGKLIGGNSQWLLGFNEPDIYEQANLTPEKAASLWTEVARRYPNQKLVSPACIWPEWLQKWYPLVQRKPDALAAHCYVESHNIPVFQQHIQRFIALAEQWNIPEVWVTEWALVLDWNVVGETHKAQQFIRDSIQWMIEQPQITRQAYFQLAYKGTEKWCWGENRNTSLVHYGHGEITVLGDAYKEAINASPPPPPPPPPDPLPTDVNKDGQVDIEDLILVLRDLGKRSF